MVPCEDWNSPDMDKRQDNTQKQVLWYIPLNMEGSSPSAVPFLLPQQHLEDRESFTCSCMGQKLAFEAVVLGEKSFPPKKVSVSHSIRFEHGT